ncbi:replication initiator protein [Blackfly microvirus SF02]|uniref:Replication initiator protein n=1 Tax=Blackfly microvirus SF02 TaxID=2576452 RepID=A0A4P8PKX8_9VIRU|nr:replication initiator protein [Blackfly microvirus SF02]
MACFHPVHGYRAPNGQIVSSPSRGWIDRPASRRCGNCTGCRHDKSAEWAVRCVHESQSHKQNIFITLTYRPEDLPYPPSLDLKTFQDFNKKLRKHVFETSGQHIRFYHCGEYGSKSRRPHYHAIIFGYDFPDKRLHKVDKKTGEQLYTSETLSKIWGLGFASIGTVTFNSAAYVARYIVAKINGDLAADYYSWHDPITGEIFDLKPEYATMSLKPGIARAWFDKYSTDVFPHDHVIIKGRKMRPPKYYDTLYERVHADAYRKLKTRRLAKIHKSAQDNTPERLAVRKQVFLAKIKTLKRSLE